MFDQNPGVEIIIVPQPEYNRLPAREWYCVRHATQEMTWTNECYIEGRYNNSFTVKIKLHPTFDFKEYRIATVLISQDSFSKGGIYIPRPDQWPSANMVPKECVKSSYGSHPKSDYKFSKRSGRIEVKLVRGWPKDHHGEEVNFKFSYECHNLLQDWKWQEMRNDRMRERLREGQIDNTSGEPATSTNPITSKPANETDTAGSSDSTSQESSRQQAEIPAVDGIADATQQPEMTSPKQVNETTTLGMGKEQPKGKANARTLAELELEEIDLGEQEIQMKKRRIQAKRRLLELGEDDD